MYHIKNAYGIMILSILDLTVKAQLKGVINAKIQKKKPSVVHFQSLKKCIKSCFGFVQIMLIKEKISV